MQRAQADVPKRLENEVLTTGEEISRSDWNGRGWREDGDGDGLQEQEELCPLNM